MNQKLVIIILAGVIAGMILSTPTFAVDSVFIGGLVFGGLAGAIGYFTLRHNAKKESV